LPLRQTRLTSEERLQLGLPLLGVALAEPDLGLDPAQRKLELCQRLLEIGNLGLFLLEHLEQALAELKLTPSLSPSLSISFSSRARSSAAFFIVDVCEIRLA
jgi:hypothetical protein